MPSDALIPNADWRRFCERFSYGHRGWSVTVFIVATEMLEKGTARDSVDLLIHDQHLQDVAAIEHGEEREFVIVTGEGAEATRQTVIQPTALIVVHEINGTEAALRIDSASGWSTILSFQAITRSKASEVRHFAG